MAARRYYRRPQAVDAIQYDGDNLAELDAWIDPGHFDYDEDAYLHGDDRAAVLITEGHAWKPLYPGNWVISPGDGEYTILANAQFEADYDPADGA